MEAPNAIVEIRNVGLIARLRYIFRNRCVIYIEPNEDVEGYDVHISLGRKPKRFKDMIKEELDD